MRAYRKHINILEKKIVRTDKVVYDINTLTTTILNIYYMPEEYVLY
jgi:hypothetical protein